MPRKTDIKKLREKLKKKGETLPCRIPYVLEISRYDTHGVNKEKYISLAKIFENEEFKKENPLFNHTRTEYCDVRMKTVEKCKERFKLANWSRFDHFYNSNKIFLIDLGDVFFGELDCLKPLVQGIECYSHFQDGKQYISFVVKRKLFVEYMQQLKTKNFDEVELKIKDAPKSNYGRDSTLYRKWYVEVNKKEIWSDKTPLVNKFLKWCELNGQSQTQGMGLALEAFFEKYNFDEPLVRELDLFDLLPPVSTENMVQKDGMFQSSLYIPSLVYARVRDMMTNYNRDPENGHKKRLTVSEFYLMLLKYFFDNNKEWALRYGNPEIYAELKQQADDARFNNRLDESTEE